MGLDITVPAVDWDAEPERGWMWPAASGMPWWARNEFHSTTGSCEPHFWAGQAWEDVREHAGPEQRTHAFPHGLVWDNGADTEDDTVHGVSAADPAHWHRRPLLACPPATVSAPAGHWARAEPLLESLPEPYGVHAACPGRWIEDFDEFSAPAGVGRGGDGGRSAPVGAGRSAVVMRTHAVHLCPQSDSRPRRDEA